MPSTQEIEEKARELFHAGQALEAADCLLEGLAQHPKCVDLQGPLVIALGHADAFGEAALAFRQYRSLGGSDAYLLGWGALSLFHTGQKTEALEVAEELAEEPVLDPESGNRVGGMLSWLVGDQGLAHAACHIGLRIAEKLAAHYPEDADAKFALGYWLHAGWQLNTASLQCIAIATTLAPERWGFWLFMGQLLNTMGLHDEALRAWLTVPLSEIDQKTVLERMVELSVERSRWDDATNCLQRLYALRREEKHRMGVPPWS